MACSLHNSVKLGVCSPEQDFGFFFTIQNCAMSQLAKVNFTTTPSKCGIINFCISMNMQYFVIPLSLYVCSFSQSVKIDLSPQKKHFCALQYDHNHRLVDDRLVRKQVITQFANLFVADSTSSGGVIPWNLKGQRSCAYLISLRQESQGVAISKT